MHFADTTTKEGVPHLSRPLRKVGGT